MYASDNFRSILLESTARAKDWEFGVLFQGQRKWKVAFEIHVFLR